MSRRLQGGNSTFAGILIGLVVLVLDHGVRERGELDDGEGDVRAPGNLDAIALGGTPRSIGASISDRECGARDFGRCFRHSDRSCLHQGICRTHSLLGFSHWPRFSSGYESPGLRRVSVDRSGLLVRGCACIHGREGRSGNRQYKKCVGRPVTQRCRSPDLDRWTGGSFGGSAGRGRTVLESFFASAERQPWLQPRPHAAGLRRPQPERLQGRKGHSSEPADSRTSIRSARSGGWPLCQV